MTAVLHVISGLGTGGAETMLVQLATALQSAGMGQHVVSVRDRGTQADRLEAGGVPVTALGVESAPGAPAGLVRLVRLVNRLDPPIVQGWMYHGNLLAAFAHRLARRRASRSLLWNLRASDMDAARYGRLVRRSARLSAWPDLIIANSEAGAACHRQKGYRPRDMLVIANGIDTGRFRPDSGERARVRAELGIASDAVVAIHVARLDPMKDHATFLAAVAANPGVTAILVGSGTDTLDVPANARALGLRSDTSRLYAASDIVVSSSAFGEGFSNVLAEGMSAGLVPVATDVGDARRIVGDTGHVVPPKDAAALGAGIAAAATEGAEDRRAHGLRARRRIVDRFTIERATAAFAEVYRARLPRDGAR